MGNGAAYFSKKQSWLCFAVSLVLGGAAAALLCVLFAGPKLGPWYDMLLARRPVIPLAREILIINTGPGAAFPQETPGEPSAFDLPENVLEPSAATSLLMTLSEFDAATLILQAPVLGLSAGSSAREDEIRYRFDREFEIIHRNIGNLFDAIRTGSIAPSEAARYVGELASLSESGKERLINALVSRDEEGIREMERAARIFGGARRPGDLLVQVIRAGNPVDENAGPKALADNGEYSRASPDPDGIRRRVAPVRLTVDREGRPLEHIIFSALKTRYRNAGIQETEQGPTLVLEDKRGRRAIPLDSGGALLFEMNHRSGDFRRVFMTDFLDYEEADKSLRLLLGEAGTRGIYDLIQGEENPVYLYDYALSMRGDLLEAADLEEKKARWKKARNAYFAGLDDFLYGPTEMILVGRLERARSPGQADEARDVLLETFAELRETYREVLDLRTRLESGLAGSFCILGPAGDGPGTALTDTEVSALLANSVITGRAIHPGGDLPLFWGALAAAALTAFVLRSQGAAQSLWRGLLLTLFTGLVFSVSFMLSGFWLDPRVPVAAAGIVTLVSFVWALGRRFWFGRLFRSCYGPFIAPSGLKHLIRSGSPKPKELIALKAAVIAVRNPMLFRGERQDNPKSSAAAILNFREKIAGAVQKAGGVVAGNGGDLVLACFGSPLERVVSAAKTLKPGSRDAPILRAAAFIEELLRREECRSWFFALDTRLCAFTWSPLSGYSVFGPAVANVRAMSSLGERSGARALITASALSILPETAAKNLGPLNKPDGSPGEPVYELLL